MESETDQIRKVRKREKIECKKTRIESLEVETLDRNVIEKREADEMLHSQVVIWKESPKNPLEQIDAFYVEESQRKHELINWTRVVSVSAKSS